MIYLIKDNICMKKRNTLIGLLLTLIPWNQAFLFKTVPIFATSGLILAIPQKVVAENALFYYKRGFDKHNKGDYLGSISDFTKVIELKPSDLLLAGTLHNRGLSKFNLKNYEGALKDFNKSIFYKSDLSVNVYVNRGNVKFILEDNYGAISDYTEAIKLNSNTHQAYKNRSLVKEKIGDFKGACTDAKKAVSLGNVDNRNINWIKDTCN